MMHKRVRFQGPVLTIGSQDIWASYDQLKSFFRELGCPYSEATVIPHTSDYFKRNMPLRAENFVHARTFFEMMGIKDYWDIDKFDYDKPEILHDLNLPVPAELHDKFNLIVDGGTIEHIFDIRQTMENIVQMCKVSGWVVHMSPSSNCMDDGFYSFSPCFFYDFYRANGFDEFTCYIWQVNPRNGFERCPYFEYTYGMTFDELIYPHKRVMVFFVARKAADRWPVTIPTQGLYDPNSKCSQNRVSASTFSLYDRLIPSLLRPFLRPIRPIRPLLGRIRRIVLPTYRLLKRM